VNFRVKKLSLKSLALSGLFGAKWFGPNCTTGVGYFECFNPVKSIFAVSIKYDISNLQSDKNFHRKLTSMIDVELKLNSISQADRT